MTTRRSICVITGLILLLLVFAGCDDNDTNISKTLQTVDMSNEALLREAINAMSEVGSYSIKADVTVPDMVYKIAADLDLEKRRSSIDVQAYGIKAQIIILGRRGYVSIDDGKTWNRRSLNGAGTGMPELMRPFNQIEPMWFELTEEEVEKAKGQFSDGATAIEQIDGVLTKHMVSNVKSLPTLATVIDGDAVTEGTIDIWVSGDSPYYVHQMKLEGKAEGKDVRANIQWSNFNKGFSIEEPKAKNESLR